MKSKNTPSTPRWHRLRAIFIVAIALALFAPGTMAAPAHQGTGEYDLCDLLPVGPGLQLLPGPEGGKYECSVSNNGAKRKFLHFSIKKRPSIEIAHREITTHVNFLDDLRKQSGGPTSEATTAYGEEGYGFFLPHNPITLEWASIAYARNCYAVYGMVGSDPESSLNVLDPGPLMELSATVDRQLKDFPCDLPPTQKPLTTDTEVDLKVQHIEVVQVVQDPENTIPLVAGKKTVVRVFVLAESESRDAIYNVSGSLSFWPEGKSEVQLQPLNQALGVKPFKSADRTLLDSSINFVIPPEQAAAGNFTLKATVNPTRSIKEINHDNNEATEPFEFIQRNGLRVGFVRIGYRPPGQTEWAWPTDSIATYDGMMKKLFPAADNGIQYYEMPFRVRTTKLISSDDDGENLNWDLREYYDRIQGDKPDILVGWLPTNFSNTFTFAGLGETVMSGQAAHVLLAVDHPNRYTSDHVLPHEVGHDLGLDHTGTRSDPRSDCRLSKSISPTYWPQKYGDSAAIQEIGFDTQAMKVIPGTYYDLMAYCSEAKTWLSTFHYMKLYDNNLRPQGTYVTDTAHKAWVRGWAAFKGYTAQVDLVRPPDPSSGGSAPPTHSTNLHPNLAASIFLPLTSGGMQKATMAIQSEGEGNHCLRFLDPGDAVLYERCFDLTFVSNESGEPQEISGFVLGVPDPGNATRLVLVRNDNGQEQELTSLEATTQPPTLTITSPQSGDRWEGEHTITWSADDPDNDLDTIRYDILYSPDDKRSWLPLQVGTYETEYTFSTEEILPGDQTYIRILASDGFNTTHSDVGPLVIPSQPNSPSAAPAPPSQGANPPAGSTSSLGGGLPGWALAAIAGGTLFAGVLVVGMGFIIARSSRRRVLTQPAGAAATASPPANPWPAPTQPTQTPPAPKTSTHTPAPASHSPNPPAHTLPTPTPISAAQPSYPPTPQYAPPMPPPANLTPFQKAQIDYTRLRGDLAAGRITPQQYEASVNTMRVQDQYGRYWMMGAADGLWYVYDGLSWVRANPS